MKKKSPLKSLPRGHEWGLGRSTEIHQDRRSKRKRTRKAANEAAIREQME